MNKRVTFSGDDFIGSGQTIVRADVTRADGSVDKCYKIGYTTNPKGSIGDRFVTKTNMTDGWTTLHDSKQSLAEYLNQHGVGFRPATDEELADIVRQGNRFEE